MAKKKPEAKRPRGRPPIDNPAILRLNVRITPDQRAAYQVAADAKGLTLSAWVESLLNRAAK